MQISSFETTTGIRIIPVNAERMLTGSHGFDHAELDLWVQFKFTEISESLAQAWTGIPLQFIARLEELNEGRPVRNYALHQLMVALQEKEPDFNPNEDYVYVCAS